jgi:glycosyltransferase involved in cell wall biosynthesis
VIPSTEAPLAQMATDRSAVRTVPPRSECDQDALVFVTPWPPFPTVGGAPIRMQRLLDALADAFHVTLVTLEQHPNGGTPYMSAEELQERLPRLEVIGVRGRKPPPDLTALSARARGILSPRASMLRPYMESQFAHAVEDVIRNARPALVHNDFHVIGGINRVPGAVNVVAPHNVEHRIHHAEARQLRGRRRVWAELDWRKLRRFERVMWRRMDLCLAVSELDAAAMRAGGARHVEICPNGADPVDQLPLPNRHPGDPIKLVFVGNSEYPPNARGVRWVVEKVLPRIRANDAVELDVVGKPPLEPYEASGVRYVGAVPSVAPWYSRAHAAIVPVFEGSGTRLKVPEALIYGRPVVSTSLGAEGLPIQPGMHYFEANDVDAFARAIIEVGRRCEQPNQHLAPLLAQGRRAVGDLMWPQIGRRLVGVYREAIRRHDVVQMQQAEGNQ